MSKGVPRGRIPLLDLGEMYNPDNPAGPDAWRAPEWEAEHGQLFRLKLIDPAAAIGWVAHRTFYPAASAPVKMWSQWHKDVIEREGLVEIGMERVAERAIAEAVCRQQIRCAIVDSSEFTGWSGESNPRLDQIAPSVFAEFDVRPSWDDGPFVLELGMREEPGTSLLLENVLFFWDDVLKLWPGDAAISPPSSAAGATAMLSNDAPPVQARRARRSRNHGAAIGRFTLDLASMVNEALQALSYREAGDMLIKAYQAVGETSIPHHDTAAADAAKVKREILDRRQGEAAGA